MHAEYTLLMSLVLDDEATPAEAQQLRAHLLTCHACAGIWERWQAIDHRLDAAPLVLPSGNLVKRVMTQVEARELRRRRWRWFSSGLLISWLAMALVGLVIIATLILLGARYPSLAESAMSAALQLVTGASWLLVGLATCAGDLGAPIVAAGVGLLATATCLFGMLWLWVLGRNQGTATSFVSITK